ncbi:hypothetical protein J28TS4_56680 [Paenibacillus lautus]|uniref:hypothetical protein n=1 Tax=Paenibacillus lautus TaxID=1401 RepID=UPI001B2B2EC8|nr:hypothetical protein [Paenibacillus lautus]GIP07261.1 hypothetical protein J28TS4_56680 [Paenibacillus lautus]
MLFLRCNKNKLKKHLNIPLREYSLCGILKTRKTAAKKEAEKRGDDGDGNRES